MTPKLHIISDPLMELFDFIQKRSDGDYDALGSFAQYLHSKYYARSSSEILFDMSGTIFADVQNLQMIDLTGISLVKCIFKNINFMEATFQDSNLTGTSFINCNLKGANMRGAILTNTSFDKASMKNCHSMIFSSMTLDFSNFQDAKIDKFYSSKLSEYEKLDDRIYIDLSQQDFDEFLHSQKKQSISLENFAKYKAKIFEEETDQKIIANFTNVNFSGINITDVNIQFAVFEKCNFSASTLNKVEASGSIFSRCRFSEVIIRDSNFDFCRMEECIFGNCQLENDSYNYCDMSRADFFDCLISTSNMVGSILRQSQFSKCQVYKGNFNEAYMAEVKMDNIVAKQSVFKKIMANDMELNSCDFSKNCHFNLANLLRSKFQNCDLQTLDLSEANLSSASLLNSKIDGAIFAGTRINMVTKFVNLHDPRKVLGSCLNISSGKTDSVYQAAVRAEEINRVEHLSPTAKRISAILDSVARKLVMVNSYIKTPFKDFLGGKIGGYIAEQLSGFSILAMIFGWLEGSIPGAFCALIVYKGFGKILEIILGRNFDKYFNAKISILVRYIGNYAQKIGLTPEQELLKNQINEERKIYMASTLSSAREYGLVLLQVAKYYRERNNVSQGSFEDQQERQLINNVKASMARNR